jgi:hypothetical protein
MHAAGTVGRKSFRSTVPPKPNPALEGTRGSGGFSLCGRFLRAPLSFALGIYLDMDTAKRLLREYWLALLLAIGWTGYNSYSATRPWSIKDGINIFGPTFFLLSWVTGQFFRVRKQALTERNFEEIIETITGGTTFPLVSTILREPTRGAPDYPSGLILSPRGEHSLYDLTVIVTDIDQLRALQKSGQLFGMEAYMKRFQLGTLGRAYEQVLFRFEPSPAGAHSFNIQSFARNGRFNERLLIRKVGERWTQAHRVMHEKLVVAEYIQADFPREELGDLDPEQPIL